MLFQPSNFREFNCYSYAMDKRETWVTVGMRDKEFSKSFSYTWDFLRKGGSIDKLVEIFVKKDVLVKFPKFKIITKKQIKKILK